MESLMNKTQKYFITQEGDDNVPDLSWKNVAVASAFILVNGTFTKTPFRQQKRSKSTDSLFYY